MATNNLDFTMMRDSLGLPQVNPMLNPQAGLDQLKPQVPTVSTPQVGGGAAALAAGQVAPPTPQPSQPVSDATRGALGMYGYSSALMRPQGSETAPPPVAGSLPDLLSKVPNVVAPILQTGQQIGANIATFATGRDVQTPLEQSLEAEKQLARDGVPVPTQQPQAAVPQAPNAPVGQGTVLQTPTVPTAQEVGLTTPNFAQQAQPQPQGLTTVGGIPLSDFLSGDALPEQGLLRAENPMYSDTSQSRGLQGEAAASAMEAASADRTQRLVEEEARRAAVRAGGSGDDGRPDFRSLARAQGAKGSAVNALADQMESEFDARRSPANEGGMTDYQKAQIALQTAGLELKMSEADAKAQGIGKKEYESMAKASGALQSLKSDLDLVRSKGEQIKDLTMKPRTEGLLAKTLSKISPTSTAAQLERASGTLTGDAFIKGMRVIKEFGGGLGSVTEVEGMKVERAQGAIFEPGMSDAERRKAVDTYVKVREDAYGRIREAFVDRFGEQAAENYLGAGGSASSSQGNVPNVQGVTIKRIN